MDGSDALIHLLEVVAMIAVAVWIISAGVRSGIRNAGAMQSNSHPAVTGPLLADDVGPGKFRITGVDRESRMDVEEFIGANSAANAKAKAELSGILVTAVDRVPDVQDDVKMWFMSGVHEKSGAAMTHSCFARTETEARVKAAAAGLVVANIRSAVV